MREAFWRSGSPLAGGTGVQQARSTTSASLGSGSARCDPPRAKPAAGAFLRAGEESGLPGIRLNGGGEASCVAIKAPPADVEG